MARRRGRIRVRIRRLAAAAGTVLLIALGACGGSGDSDSAGGGGSGSAAGPQSGPAAEVSLGSASVPALAASIVKTADLQLEVAREELDDAVDRATATAATYGGFVYSTSIDDKEGEARRASLVVRVPSNDFEQALADIKGIGDVREQSVSGKDVSQQFIDLQARIRNLGAQENVLIRLMRRATSISQTITVQDQLSGVQLEIERLEGRLRFLQDRTELGTISISLIEEGAPAPARPGTLGRAWQRALDVALAILAGVIVTLGALAPLVAMIALGYAVLMTFRRVLASSR
jgi:hypothetical protein